MNPEQADSWASLLSGPTGGWVACVVLSFVLGTIIVLIVKRYESYRTGAEDQLKKYIESKTELLVQNKIQNDQVINLNTQIVTLMTNLKELMSNIKEKLDD